MSGHSHWSSIKYKKAAADQRRSTVFSKLIRAIMVAARTGSDLTMNVRLRHAVEAARGMDVPKDRIETAVKKGAGELDGQEMTELTLEGFGPGGTAMVVEAVTDNANRCIPEVRKLFENRGGKLGSGGSTKWMFKRKGLLSVKKDAVDEEKLMEIILEAGADDMTDADDVFEIYTPAEALDAVKKALETNEIAPEVAELTYIADNEVELAIEVERKNLNLMEAVGDHDDVQNVYANFTPSAEALASLKGE